MDSREVFQFVDEVVYTKTGKHLNDLQRGIIEGTLNRQKYSDIAKNYNCTTGHTKEVGFELWRMLSEIFGEPVDKKHLRSVLERQGNLNIFLGDSNVNSNILGSGCIINNSNRLNPNLPKTHLKQGKIEKLRQLGLSDEEIAEILDIPLEAIKQVDLED